MDLIVGAIPQNPHCVLESEVDNTAHFIIYVLSTLKHGGKGTYAWHDGSQNAFPDVLCSHEDEKLFRRRSDISLVNQPILQAIAHTYRDSFRLSRKRLFRLTLLLSDDRVFRNASVTGS
jgi:hypothetical protein